MTIEWLLIGVYIVGGFLALVLQQDVAERQARPWLWIDSVIVLFWPVELTWWAIRKLRDRWED